MQLAQVLGAHPFTLATGLLPAQHSFDPGARASDEARLRAAWRPLSRMDELAEEWRGVYQVHIWIEEGAGQYQTWSPPSPDLWPSDEDTDVVERACALRDSNLRRRLDSPYAAAVR